VYVAWNDRAIALAVGTHVVGRDPDAAVWIESSVVSRRHAQLVVHEHGVTIEDFGSHNGTFVNGERVTAARPLAHGDEIRIGPAKLILHDSPDPTATATDRVR
jgi:pSer/pThr/pTyr-binding forkhead associated (FHA) protein